jgi:hypothetical protein
VIVVLGMLACFLWWRRKPRRAPDLGERLVADARAFRRGLPALARRSYDSFQPVVVLGTESSGKAAIVERFSGVAQRRIELGPGAEHAGGQLRCALGGDVVVFAPSEESVRAPEGSAGLARALAPTLRTRPPLVVVCIAPELLDTHTAPQLATLGGMLRAQLDLLAAVRDEPCTVRVVMSDVPGPGTEAILSIDHVDAPALHASLRRYADEIAEPLDRLGFLEVLPDLASALAVLLGEVFAPAGHFTPRPDGLYLVPVEGGPNPLRAHRMTAFRPVAKTRLRPRQTQLSSG